MGEYKAEPLTKYPAELYSTIRLKGKYAKGDHLTFWPSPCLSMPYPQCFEIMEIRIVYMDGLNKEQDPSFFRDCTRIRHNCDISLHHFPLRHIYKLGFEILPNSAGMYTLRHHRFECIKIKTFEFLYVRLYFEEAMDFPENSEISMILIGDIYSNKEPKQKMERKYESNMDKAEVASTSLYPV